MILASIAMNEGHETAIMDLNSQRPVPTWQDAAKQMAVEKWDVIAVGGLSSMYKDITKVLKIARKLNPDALIVCGGGFITYMPDKIMKYCPEIDIAGIGEGEELFRDVLLAKEKNENWKNVKGICYREDEQLLFTEPRPLIPDLDTLPLPAYDLVDVEAYFKFSGSLWAGPGIWQSKRRMNMVTERGCPRQCTFCTHNGMNRWDQEMILGKEKVRMMDKEAGFQAVVRFFSPRYVIDHALLLYENYKIDYLCLMDENNTAYPGRIMIFVENYIIYI